MSAAMTATAGMKRSLVENKNTASVRPLPSTKKTKKIRANGETDHVPLANEPFWTATTNTTTITATTSSSATAASIPAKPITVSRVSLSPGPDSTNNDNTNNDNINNNTNNNNIIIPTLSVQANATIDTPTTTSTSDEKHKSIFDKQESKHHDTDGLWKSSISASSRPAFTPPTKSDDDSANDDHDNDVEEEPSPTVAETVTTTTSSSLSVHSIRPATTSHRKRVVMTSYWGPLVNALLYVLGMRALAQAFWMAPKLSTSTSSSSSSSNDPPLPSHIIPPSQATKPSWISMLTSKVTKSSSTATAAPSLSTTVTLRSFLTDPQSFALAMGPAFFGFYGYFGVLAAWDEHLRHDDGSSFLQASTTSSSTSSSSTSQQQQQRARITKLAGASAGAIAAVLLASGVPPRQAADFASTLTLDHIADMPAWGGLFRGQLAEQTMHQFLYQQMTGRTNESSLLLLQNAPVCPVGVSVFDLQTMQGKILTEGSMARAALASATFPLLFEPMGWKDRTTGEEYTLIDGGITDMAGVAALEVLQPQQERERIVNLKVGSFYTNRPPGPDDIMKAQRAEQVLSISIQNLPQVGPFALELGPVAVQAAYDAVVASLDVPLYESHDQRHYELHIDAAQFWGEKK